MKESIIKTIISGGFIADMKGIGRWTVLRTGAALFKADVPACVINFSGDIKEVADFTRLLADRFGPDIIITADKIDSKKLAKMAVRSGVRAAFCPADKKIASYLRKKGVAVFIDAKGKEDISFAENFSAEAVRIFRNLKTTLPKIKKADSLDDLKAPFSGEYIPMFSSPVITKEILETKDYDKIEALSKEIIEKFLEENKNV